MNKHKETPDFSVETPENTEGLKIEEEIEREKENKEKEFGLIRPLDEVLKGKKHFLKLVADSQNKNQKEKESPEEREEKIRAIKESL